MAVNAPTKPSTLPSPHPSTSFWHSEPSEALLGHRTTPDLPEHADVVIVGSGITGTSVAWHLLQQPGNQTSESRDASDRPLHVVMLDAREACWGATGRNGGHCQPIVYEHATDPAIGHFELANFDAVAGIISSLDIDCEFQQLEAVHALFTNDVVSATEADLATLKTTDPALAAHVHLVTDPSALAALRVPNARAAVVMDRAARLWPYKLVAGVLEKLLATHPSSSSSSTSFNLQTTTPATSLTHAYDPASTSKPDPTTSDPPLWTLSTPRGRIVAPKIVLATNGYTSALVPAFADLVTPCRGQMSALRPSAGLRGSAHRLSASYCFYGGGRDDYLIQRDEEKGGLLMFGGGRHVGVGLSLGASDDAVVDPAVARYLRGQLGWLLLGDKEGEELSAVQEWTGIMGFSRDGRPWVGRVPGMDGVFVSAGYTGHGMPNAWLCGKAVAEMVMGVEEGGAGKEGKIGALPKSYVLNMERMERARRLEGLEVRDEAHLAWMNRQGRSGYIEK